MASTIEAFRITRYEWPRDRPIGDSQVRADWHYTGSVELTSTSGQVGLGFFGALFYPLPPLSELNRVFATELFPGLVGQNPFTLAHRVSRPRGGNIGKGGGVFGLAVDQALWDLEAKELGLPLYRLLGGTNNRVPAYASGLDYHLSTEEAVAFFAEAKRQGFDTFKVKVGNPDLQWDLDRLCAIDAAVGPGARLMVDANEAWSPKEAIRRAHAYHDAGLNIFWIEDPVLRDDFAGLAEVRRAVPFAHINSGEYLDLRGKRMLLEARGVDVLNIHGGIAAGLHVGWLAAEYGVPISLGNTPFELGVHLAAALPEVWYLEYSFQDYNRMVETPVQFADGYAFAPDRPGHGLTLSEYARHELAKPEPGQGGR